MLSLYDYQHTPERLADLLPWFALVGDDPCVLRHKDGSLQHTLRFQGHDLEAVTASELVVQAAQLNNVLRRFGSGWAVFVEHAKRRVRDYPAATWPTSASARADTERRQYFLESPHYTMDQAITLVWRPLAVLEQRFARWVTTGSRTTTAHAHDVEVFQDQVRQFTHLLDPCMAWVQPLGPAGTLSYLHAAISTEPHHIAVPEVPAYLDCGLCDRDFVPGMQPALITGLAPTNGHPPTRWQDRFTAQHLRTLTITGFPNETYPCILEALSSLPLEFRYVIRWQPLDQVDAYTLMKHRLAIWKQAMVSMKQRVMQQLASDTEPPEPDREARLKKGDVDAAMDACMAGGKTFGYFTATVTVWDAADTQAVTHLREVQKVITGKGFTCHEEHLNATEAWLGSVPGECYKNIRKPMLTSMNLAHAFLGGVYTGPERDEHLGADAVMVTDTSGNIPYRIVLHEHGVGHALIIGPSGAGKTTLVGALALQFQRYHTLGARVRLVDKKEGLAPVTAAMDGDHYTLGGEEGGVTFQPLRGIEDLMEREWAQAWIEGLCEGQRVLCTPAQRQELWEALTGMAALPVPLRTITGLARLVQDAEVRQALHPYTMAGAYGRVLDAVADPLTLRPWSCFETDRLFQIPGLVAPTLGVLFHQLATTFQEKKPTLFVLDEAWRYLAHLDFRDQIEEWLRELRKLHVNLVFSTQDPSEILESPIASILRNQCKIRFFLPNREALEPDNMQEYRRMGLNDRQIELLATALPHRHYLLHTQDGCRLIDLALGPVQLSLLTTGVLP